MASVAELVNKVSNQLVPASELLPVGLKISFSALHSVHRLWRYYRRGRLLVNTENLFKIAADQGLSYMLRDHKIVQLGAQCILIVRCMSDLADGHVKLMKSYQKLVAAGKSYYPYIKKNDWITSAPCVLVSASTWQGLIFAVDDAISRVELIAKCSLKLFWRLFNLSMLTMDAIEAFSSCPLKRQEAAGEIVSNTTKLLAQAAEESASLPDKLRAHQALIQQVLAAAQAGYTAEQLIESVESAVKKTQSVKKVTQQMNSSVTQTIVMVVKELAYGFLSTIGLEDFTPPLAKTFPARTNQRFVPKEWITHPDAPMRKQKTTLKCSQPDRAFDQIKSMEKVHAICLSLQAQS